MARNVRNTKTKSDSRSKVPSGPERTGHLVDPKMVDIKSPDGTDVISVPTDVYESIDETVAIEADAKLMAALKKSAADVAAGRTLSWVSVKAELGL